jgi:L-methionine (R)-S-oxide reductase
MVETVEMLGDLQRLREQGYLSDALLRHAVRGLAQTPDFDWVGVYLLGEEGTELWLHNYMGAGTDHAKIPVGTGVCGTAVATGENQNVPDVREVDNYLSCNPAVRSELVVLIRAGKEIFGQLDIDSKTPAAFSDEHVAAVQMIADKLAEQFMHQRR